MKSYFKIVICISLLIGIGFLILKAGPTDDARERSTTEGHEYSPANGLVAPVIVSPKSINWQELEGPWDIISFNGYEPQHIKHSDLRSAYIDFRPEHMSFRIECNYSGFAVRLDKNKRLVDRNPNDPKFMTQMGCLKGKHERELALLNFLLSSPGLHWQGNNNLRLFSNEQEVILKQYVIEKDEEVPFYTISTRPKSFVAVYNPLKLHYENGCIVLRDILSEADINKSNTAKRYTPIFRYRDLSLSDYPNSIQWGEKTLKVNEVISIDNHENDFLAGKAENIQDLGLVSEAAQECDTGNYLVIYP